MLRLLASGEGPALTSACLSAGRLAHRRYQTAAPPQRLGFVGLGIMGTAMATNLVKAGHEVTVWNRNPAKCKPLGDLGAAVAGSAKAVAEASDITFGMLSDPEAARHVALGPQGVVEGTLIFLTGGDKQLFDSASPALDVMGKAKFFLGEAGKGAQMKLVVNMIMGSMMASFAEGIVLAEEIGLEKEDLLEVIGLGAINSPMYNLKGPNMIQRSYPTAFPLKHQQKDLRLALQLGEKLAQITPMAAAANELYKASKAGGNGDADFSAVLEALLNRRPNGN